jgi:hypothetical protein
MREVRTGPANAAPFLVLEYDARTFGALNSVSPPEASDADVRGGQSAICEWS